jgi:flagellar hook assembly protein FlgD
VATATFTISAGELEFVDSPRNYPNPFVDETAFAFDLTQPAEVTIKIYTVSGKLIRVLRTNAEAGYTIVEWDGRDAEGDPISNGAYLYKVIARSGDRQIEKIEKLARIR